VIPLFDSDGKPPETASVVVRVAVNQAIWRTLDYAWPAALGSPARGLRVRVPLGKGNKLTPAFVVEVLTSDQAARRNLKPVAQKLDHEPQLHEPLMRLGEWISHYYLAPLGMTLAAMVPAAVGAPARQEEVVSLTGADPNLAALGTRQRRAMDHLLEASRQGIGTITLQQLRLHSGADRQTVVSLVRRGLVALASRPVVLQDTQQVPQADEPVPNEDQLAAIAAIRDKLGKGFSATLLHGVTGSGKTEVYVRLIREVVAAGRQAILLTPEIALASQTLTRLVTRLPRVAVLHSGLSAAQRAFYYQQVRDGGADVVVGARSALFAPARNLGLIIVDEEHEGSYKQDSAPRYHARDAAVMRAVIEKVPVVLGSATPSLESLYNARQGKYDLVRLPRRVRGLPMPRLEVVHLRRELQGGVVEIIGRTLTLMIAQALDRREQVILLMNRRGYASYVFCPSCGWIMGCERCSRALVFHQATRQGLCHYCDHSAELPAHCPACDKKLLLFGYGIQRIEDEIQRKFPHARVARMDSDTMTSPEQFQQVLGQFSRRELDILLGTQMVAKGLDFPGVSLVGVASADTSLAIPDFRAAERTFQLIVQVAGRAGRGATPGAVVVQTLVPQEPAIRLAQTHDYAGFAAAELPARFETGTPPATRLVRLVLRDEDASVAQLAAAGLAKELKAALGARGVRVAGPQPCGVLRMNNLYRFEILLFAQKPGVVQQWLWPRMEELSRRLEAELVADVDPLQLL
jgi:primosomal protein N' (replication factor Y)